MMAFVGETCAKRWQHRAEVLVDGVRIQAIGHDDLNMRPVPSAQSRNHPSVIAAEPFARGWMREIVVAISRGGSHPDAPDRRVTDDGVFNRRVECGARMRVNRVDTPISVA